MFSRVHGHITKVSQRFGPHKTNTHMRTHAQKGVNLTCLCFPCRQEVPGPVHAWTWCPAGVTLGSALKYPIYYFDELPWNFALTRVHREFSFIAGTRSTVSHLMKYPDSSHTFTMKFGADMNGFHLPFSQHSLPSRGEERCGLSSSVWSSIYMDMFTKWRRASDAKPVNSVLMHTYQVSNKWVDPLGELVEPETRVYHQHLMRCSWWMEAKEAVNLLVISLSQMKRSADPKCTKNTQLDADD